jgi:hypothetical protein
MLICRPNLPLRLTRSHRLVDAPRTSRLFANEAEIESVVALRQLIRWEHDADKAKLCRMGYAFVAI